MAADQIATYIHDLKVVAQLEAQYNQSFPVWVAYGYMGLTVLLCLFKPRLGFMLVVGNTLLRFQDRVAALNSFPIFQMFIASLLLGMLINKRQLVKTNLSIDKAMLYFLGIAILGLLYQDPLGLKAQLTVLVSSMLYYYFATRLIGNEKELRQLLLLMTICAALLGAEALINTWNNPMASPFYLGGGRDSKRLQGLGYYNNANEFGMLMIMMIPYLYSIILGKKGLIKKLLSAGVIWILVVTMAKTDSRTVMVCLALMTGLMLIFKSGGNIVKKLMVGGIFGVVLVVGLSFVPGPIQHRLDSIMNYQSDASFQGRLRSWAMGWDMVKWYPLTGVGVGRWGQYHGLAAHNSYIDVMAETGFIGLYFYLRMIYLAFTQFRGLDSATTDVNKKLVALAVLSSFTGYLLYIFFGNQSYTANTFLYLGLCGAVGNIGLQPKTEPETEPDSELQPAQRKV